MQKKEILIKMYTSTGTQLQRTFYLYVKIHSGADIQHKGTSKEMIFLCLYGGISKTQLPRSYNGSYYNTYMSHFTYACKMWYPLNLVLES